MPQTPTVPEMVEEKLMADGFDGLYNTDGACACTIGDLAPADCFSTNCRAGYEIPCPGPGECESDGCDWHISAMKEGRGDTATETE